MKTFFVIGGLCLCLSIQAPAIAQAYKCTVDKKLVYQGTPCLTGGEQVNLSGAGKSDTTSTGATYWKKELARLDRKEKVESAVLNGKVFIGMTAEEALRSWGQPTKINQTLNGSGTSEQWVYRREGGIEGQYVYLTNGIVQSIQSPK